MTLQQAYKKFPEGLSDKIEENTGRAEGWCVGYGIPKELVTQVLDLHVERLMTGEEPKFGERGELVVGAPQPNPQPTGEINHGSGVDVTGTPKATPPVDAQVAAKKAEAASNGVVGKFGLPTPTIIQPDANGEFPSPADGAIWMLATYGIPQTVLCGVDWQHVDEKKRGKVPFLPGWQRPENTLKTVEEIQAAAVQYPGCNFGSVFNKDFFAYEADTPPEGVKRLFERYHDFSGEQFSSQLRIQSSGPERGHCYYKWADGVENIGQSGIATKHGDFSLRVQGLQCVSPGSIHPRTRKQYRVVSAGPLTPPNAKEIAFWNSERVDKPKQASKEPKERRLLKHGQMHAAYVSEAGRLWNAGYSVEQILEMVPRWTVENSEDSVDEEKVRKECLSVTNLYPRGSAPESYSLMSGSGSAPGAGEGNETPDQFHFDGLELPKSGNGNGSLCIFTSEADTKIAQQLGFNATTVVPGGGTIPTSAAITSIKMAFERVAIFGETATTEVVKSKLTPGSIFGNFPPNYNSFHEALPAIGEESVVEHIDQELSRPELVKTSLLIDGDTYKMRASGVLQASLSSLAFAVDPRIVVRAAIENMKALLEKHGSFPPALTSVSLWGLLGDFVEIAYPTTAACRELLMGSIIPIIGAMFGRGTPCTFGSDVHPGATFYNNVARTADGKGQALNHALAAIRAVDAGWANTHCHTNPNSGEALVRLAAPADKRLQMGSNPNGIRLAVVVPELSSCLTSQNRDGSTLSEMLRNGWDGVKLENQRSEERKSVVAMNYTLGVCGFITPQVLQESLPGIDWKNGSVNRFLMNVVSEHKSISRSPGVPDFLAWAKRVLSLLTLSLGCSYRVVEYSEKGGDVWDAWEHSLPQYEDGDPMQDGMGRAKPHALRLANLYAQLDERRLDGWKMALEPKHVEAGIELVERGRHSMQWYLDQDNLVSDKGYDKADLLKLRKMVAKAIEKTGKPILSGTEVYKAFTHLTPEQRNMMCLDAGMVPKQKDGGTGTGSGRRGVEWEMIKPSGV